MLICILTKNVITSCSVTMMLFLHLEVKPLMTLTTVLYFFFSRRSRHTRCSRDWSSDVCSSDLIISRAPGQDRVTQPRKKRKCIASLKEISRIESRLLRTLERPAVCHRARPGAIAVNPVSPRTQHRHLLSRDFFHASQHERRIPSPNSVSRHRRAYFSIGNQSDAPPAMHHAQLRELPQQRFRRFLDRPFIGRVIATRHKTQCFRRVVRRMKQIVHSQCQRKGRFPEGPVAGLWRFRHFLVFEAFLYG